MTREDAISIMKVIVHMLEEKYDTDRVEDAVDMAIEALEQEPCEDVISRQAVLDYIDKMPSELTADGRRMIRRITLGEYISDTLPSVTPKPKTGHWFYDKSIENWRCSECKETPKTMGYCGSANFMADHFKYCNHCGTKMEDYEET